MGMGEMEVEIEVMSLWASPLHAIYYQERGDRKFIKLEWTGAEIQSSEILLGV